MKSQIIKYLHGTTTLAFIFRAGIIISVDSRASMGSYVGSSKVKKVIEINRNLLGTMAGSAADCFFWERNLSCLCKLFEIRNNQRLSVAGSSKLLMSIIYSYRNSGLSMGTMIIGWDQNGPNIYYIDSEGSRLKVKLISVGSGCLFAYSILDSGYKWSISIINALDLGTSAIAQASFNDPYSGGYNNLYLFRSDGWVKIFSKEISKKRL